MKVEEQHVDVLQNIEFAVIAVYDAEPGLLDLEVLDAFEALIRCYTLEDRGEHHRMVSLSERPRRVFEAVRRMCEWRLGRSAVNPSAADSEEDKPTTISVWEILRCLKRLRKSVRHWNDQGGRQGYLNYVRQFVGRDAEAALGS